MARKGVGTPPYVPRKGLRAVLDHIQSHAGGEVLTREDLQRRGLSSHWTYPALAALRFLEILDDKDCLTGRHAAFNQENPDRKAQEALVRDAYSDFFEQVPVPAASYEEVRDRFREIYKLSDRVNNSAFPIFQMLAQDAGIDLAKAGAIPLAPEGEREGGERPPPEPGGEGAGETSVLLPAKEEPLRIRHTGYQIVINLSVNKYTSEKDLIKMIKTANRAIHLLKKSGDIH